MAVEGFQDLIIVEDGEVVSGGGGGNLAIEDEGVPQGTARTLNVVGAGAQISVAVDTATLNVGGASGILEIQKDDVRIDDASILNYKGNGVDVGVATGIAALRFSQDPAAIVEVDYNFPADDDTFRQYTSIATGLTKAAALASALGDYVACVVHPGYYVEQGLIVENSVALIFEDGVELSPPGGGGAWTQDLLTFRGNSWGRNIYITLGGSINSPTLNLVTLEQPSFRGQLDGMQIVGVTPTDVIKDVIHINSSTSAGQIFYLFDNIKVFYLGQCQHGFYHGAGSGAGTPVITFMQDCTIFCAAASVAGLEAVNGNLVSANKYLYCNNSYIYNVTGPKDIVLGTLVQADLRNSHYVRSKCTFGGGLNSIGMTDEGTIQQTVILEPGQSKGDLNYALTDLDNRVIENKGDIETNRLDLALLAAGAEYSQDIESLSFDGILTAIFNDALNVDLTNSFGYTIEDGHLDFSKILTNDDFELYADSSAVQAAWVRDSVSFGQVYLGTTIPYQGTKYMDVQFSASGSNHWVQKTFGTVQDWELGQSFIFYARGGLGATNGVFRIELRDVDARVATGSNFQVTNIGMWEKFEFPSSSFVIPAGFKWWAIQSIRLHCVTASAVGQFDIDVVSYRSSGVLIGGTLDAMISTTGWANVGSGGLTTGSTDPRTGVAYLQIASGAGQFQLERTYAGGGTYAPLVANDTAIRVWLRASDVTAAGTISGFTLTLYDESGNAMRTFENFTFSSGTTTWVPYEFLLDKMTEFAGDQSLFNIAQIVKVVLESNGGFGGTWNLNLNLMQRGNLSRLQLQAIEGPETYNRLTPLFPNAGLNVGKSCLSLTADYSGSSGVFNFAQEDLGKAVLNAADATEVAIASGAGKRTSFRITGSRREVFPGVSVVWRTL